MLKDIKTLLIAFLLNFNLAAIENCPGGESITTIEVCPSDYNLSREALANSEIALMGQWPAVSCEVRGDRLQVTYKVGTNEITPPTTPAMFAESCLVSDGVAIVKFRVPAAEKPAWYSSFWNETTAFITGAFVGAGTMIGILKEDSPALPKNYSK